MVKIDVDPATGVVNNKHQLALLGLGATDDEAERVARWMLGDPLMKNPAVLGAILNSTPIDVGPPGSSPLPGGKAFYDAHVNRPFLVYVGASDGMLHAFFTKPTTIGSKSYAGGQEAFAYIPQSMLQVANKLYAQGGQLPDPRDHIYGLANSPKVKSLCTSNCDGASGTPVWKTVLVMAYGFGGTEAFVLDITDPVDSNGVVTTGSGPSPLLWHTQYETPSTTAAYDNDLGLTTSVPAFYYAKSATKDDFRLIFGSYWTDTATSSTGKVLFNASATTGAIKDNIKISPSGSCPQTLGLLSDVATARNFSVNEEMQIHAAYFGDTWGNLYRYVPTVSGPSNFTDTTGNLTLVDALTCQHPIHYAPAIVQLDRDLNANHGGEIYIVQVTNSALDDETKSYPPSKMIIRRDVASAPGAVADDPTFTKITLTAGVAAELCGETDPAGAGCNNALPATARPNATPMAVLKRDGSGFQVIGTWFQPATDSCADGATYLTIHEFTVTGGVKQKFGMKLASEPVTSTVFAGGKLMFVKQGGVIDLSSMLPTGLTWGPGSNSGPPGGNERLRVLGWTEVP
ncbi:MAG TPA: PilC/PilY family type IV pilus protein [Polyangia bacterium]|nr:PilC/PilY family type IV pilus protein [Polyangia bacterium]